MPFHKRPPRGYRKMEHPLPHEFTYGASFDILDATKDATIVTAFRASEDATVGIEAVPVNPSHASFAEEAGPTCAMGSIVPQLNFTFRASLSQALLLDNEFAKVQIQFLPIYTAFLSSLDAADTKTAFDIETILELQHETGAKDVFPLYVAATDLTNGSNHPTSNVLDSGEAFGDWGLGTDLGLESVAFVPDEVYNCLQYYTNGGMLRKIIGRKQTFTLSRDRPAMYHSSNFTNPTVKRMNEYTYCGVLIWTSIPNIHAFGKIGDFDAADKDTVHWNCHFRFDEWNPDFDQTSM